MLAALVGLAALDAHTPDVRYVAVMATYERVALFVSLFVCCNNNKNS